jgi:hypothetical protein
MGGRNHQGPDRRAVMHRREGAALPLPLAGEGVGGLRPPFLIENADAKHRLWVGVRRESYCSSGESFPHPVRIYRCDPTSPQAGEVN